MCFKSSFTIPAVAAMSFCVIGGTVPAVADIDGRVSATTRNGGADSGPDAGAISAGTEASQADIDGRRVSATTRSGGADYGPSGGTALSGAGGCGPVDQTQLSSNVCMAFFSQTDLAQSFTTDATLLCGARIDLVSGTGGADVTIALWDALPNAGGNLLGSGTDFSVPDGGVAIVSFGGDIPVNPGDRYFLVFTAANGGPCIAGDTNNPYPGGHVYANAGYNPFPNFDYTFETYGTACPADFDDSGDVGVKDLLFLLGAWGPCPEKGTCPADFDDSGDVGVKDLLFLLGAWGPCPGGGECKGQVCGEFVECAFGEPFNCFCWTLFDGTGICLQNFLCDDVVDCPDGECPPGFVCVVQSCCEVNKCVPIIDCNGGAAPQGPPTGSGLTGSGQLIEASQSAPTRPRRLDDIKQPMTPAVKGSASLSGMP